MSEESVQRGGALQVGLGAGEGQAGKLEQLLPGLNLVYE